MTEAASEGQTYKPNAGTCVRCGNAKTWDFRVLNPNSGKNMPGHIDAQGHVIGDGNCPFWAGVAKKNAAKKASAGTIKSVANAAVSIPTQASTTIRTALDDDIERATRQHAMVNTVRAIPPAQPAPVAPVEVDAVAENSHVTIYIGDTAFTIPRAKADILARKLVKILF